MQLQFSILINYLRMQLQCFDFFFELLAYAATFFFSRINSA